MSSKYWQWYHLQLAFIEKGHNPNNFEETFYIHSKPKQTLFSNDNIYKYLSWPKINCRPFFWSSIPHFFLVRFRKKLRKETFIQKKKKEKKKKKTKKKKKKEKKEENKTKRDKKRENETDLKEVTNFICTSNRYQALIMKWALIRLQKFADKTLWNLH